MMVIITPFALAEEEAKTDGQALENAIAKYHHYVADKKGAWHYTRYQIISGPIQASTLHVLVIIIGLILMRSMIGKKAAGEKCNKDVLPHIANSQVSITRRDPDLGIWPDSLKDYNYFLLLSGI